MLDRILRYLPSMIFGWLTMLVLATTGCVISLSSLSTQWSNNLLTDPQLEITDPNLTDGNLETVALSVSRQKKDKSRYFVIKFPIMLQPKFVQVLELGQVEHMYSSP